MGIFRFKYILPRLLLLMVLLAVAEVGTGYFTHWAIEQGGEAALGARVEVGSSQASLLKTRVQIEDLVVANPRSAFKNLLEARRIDIDFDSSALLRKKLIAPYGEITGIRFDTQRATSGLLPESPLRESSDDAKSWLNAEAAVYARNWLDGVEQRVTQDLRRELKSVDLAEELAERWPNQYDSLRAKSRQLKQDAKQLAEQAKIAKQNPLRHIEFLTNLPNQTTALRRQVDELHTQLASLPGTLDADRRAIAAARVHDERVLRDKLTMEAIDAETLTNYLLGEQIAAPLQDAVAWLKWARGLVPESNRKLIAERDQLRGENILFPGTRCHPDFWLRSIKLSGVADVSGQPLELVGTIRDVTSDPKLVGQPMVLELRSTEGMPIRIVATIDRTSDVPRDQILIDCEALPLAGMSLGKNGPLALTVSPTLANVNVSLTLVGERLTGDVQVVQRNVQLMPHVRNERLRGDIETTLTESLGSVDQLATRIGIEGTLDRPRIKLWSNLGPVVSESTQRVVTTLVERRASAAINSARAKVDDQVGRVESQLVAFQHEIAAELGGPAQVVAQLLGQQPGGPLDQLGRLPQGSLFK